MFHVARGAWGSPSLVVTAGALLVFSFVLSSLYLVMFLLLGEPGGRLHWLILPVLSLFFLLVLSSFCLVLFCLGMFSVAWGARGSPSVVVTAGVLPPFMFVLVMPCYVVWCGKYHVCFCPCLLRVRSLASEMRGSP